MSKSVVGVRVSATALAAMLLVGRSAQLGAIETSSQKTAAGDTTLAPLPADLTVKQTVKTASGAIEYSVTAGTLAVRNGDGKQIGQVAYHAYVTDSNKLDRPVTFVFNGGPGAASVFLNLGALGPKHVSFGLQGDVPSASVSLTDNTHTWLAFTDLIFVDPVGTGFSRSLVDEDSARKYFYGTQVDVEYLSRIVYDWLVKNRRLSSPKYLVGESYGGFRVPRLVRQLAKYQGVGVNGIVLISPSLNPAFADDNDDLSPMPWVARLPSMAAAKLEREGRLSPEALAPVEAYARSEFPVDFLKGPQDAAATQRIVSRIVDLLGLEPSLVQSLGGRVDVQTLLRESHRRESKIGSKYDVNVAIDDPFPWSYGSRQEADPIIEQIIALTTSAMVDYDTRVLGWKVDAAYQAFNRDVGRRLWRRDDAGGNSVTALRHAMAVDAKLRVLIVHGYTDLSSPFFASQLIIDQLPPSLDLRRIALRVYPGGHMFYSRSESRAALYRDAQSVYLESAAARSAGAPAP